MQLFERIQLVLLSMGKNVVRCGEPGMGQMAKICNNLVAGEYLPDPMANTCPTRLHLGRLAACTCQLP
ncbi:hypothetical protein [Mycetohabitans sp. B7]